MPTAELAQVERAPLAVPTRDEIDLVKKTVAHGATDQELALYLRDCERQGVHPLDRLLHFTKRGNKYTPVTSIDLMRIRAAETGDYAGSDDATFAGDVKKPTFAATVTVWRFVQGQRCAFAATARWSEYCPPSGQDHMWQKMPHTMLGKCAEALALRKGFPRQLAGLYAKEELDQAGSGDATPRSAPASAPRLVIDKPEGFDDWWDDMRACADEGAVKLRDTWEASSKDYRRYLLDTDRDGWAGYLVVPS